ncbi:uncharacterized protein MONBRDRAFT_38891 [Monosiga brevicollis MX1]|uniref:Squalene synthase n=1 Tax=Monosiga brevicollis TaxID=81824 RepID=A9VAU0_MONBE|nr:uncharacterized protein MONBRDRAFT_38891 [Monosiga brevicollis MX1]EDQ85378.1 predicted protein [Monosiga brevicollis MX1]|eukprot:XP_001749789.1 hypothetical protein [Monosiga brevicollis MX1]
MPASTATVQTPAASTTTDASRRRSKKNLPYHKKRAAKKSAKAAAAAAAAAAVAQEKSADLSSSMNLARSLVHPSEIFSLVNFQLLGGKERLFPPNDQTEETANMQRCYYWLDKTSRSFSAVIKALHPDIRRAVCIFYLVLRGLDTVEDDMSLDENIKKDLLKSFHDKLFEPGWTFKGIGPQEKDRQLLVEFDVVIAEFLRLETKYSEVIADICKKMGAGMIKFAHKQVETVDHYNLYCHYVAGLVGIGLSRLFSVSNLESEMVGKDVECSNSMGLFLQKTNIIRDYHEDLVDGRTWWPHQIWSLYAGKLGDFVEPQHEAAGLKCLNHLVADALDLVPEVFKYMSRLQDQSIFNFCAIPQVMAIATLSLCYNNRNVLHRNVKIRKGQAVQLMMRATNMTAFYEIFEEHCLELKARAPSNDTRTHHALDRILSLINAQRTKGALPAPSQTVSVLPWIMGAAALGGAAYFAHRRYGLF